MTQAGRRPERRAIWTGIVLAVVFHAVIIAGRAARETNPLGGWDWSGAVLGVALTYAFLAGLAVAVYGAPLLPTLFRRRRAPPPPDRAVTH